MRRVIGYIDGKPIYQDLGPSNGSSGPFRTGGALVSGDPGPVERQRIAERTHKAKLKAGG